jgi:gliding motility-associated-like protein
LPLTKDSLNFSPMNKLFGLSIYLLVLGTVLQSTAQLVIPEGQTFKARAGTDIAITSSLTSSSKGYWANAKLHLVGSAAQRITSGKGASYDTLAGLFLNNASSISNELAGNWAVTNTMNFTMGKIAPAAGARLMFVKPSAAAGDISGGSADSYVNGGFFSKGTGIRFFPIGNGAGYFPAMLAPVNQGDIEIGMRVNNASPSLSHGSDIIKIFTGQYWEVTTTPAGTLAGPIVSLSSFGASSFITPTIGTVVIAADGTGAEGVSMGGGPNDDFIAGNIPMTATQKIFTLGQISSEKVGVKIHNLITPFKDNSNDHLEIENIQVFPENKVTILDRWGVEVRKWSNFKNEDVETDPTHDLSKLSTGNYICILEYKDGSNSKKLSQMITLVNQ